ncbi:MAG: PEP-CTERM sorting domain-containing protein, partial [Thermoguttaceae bacterium]|nr:PEP-CTERM sorting domain-containing protein [Thermoguttaceae bacterium]
GSVIKTGSGTLTINKTSSMNGEWRLNAGKVVITSSRSGTNTPLGANKAGSTVYVNDGVELVLSAQDVFTNAHEANPMQFVIDGGKVSNSGANYNFIENTTFKDGAQLYAADGNATWKAFKLHNVKVLRNEDGTAGAPVVFSADMSKANATYAFGTISGNAASTTSVLNVEDITSADSSVIDSVSDLVISGVIADPLTNRNGTTAAAPIEKTGAGTLKLTGAGTLGTSAVTLNENGTLELNVADGAEKSFTNKVTGTGTVAKTGAGTLKLNTANGFESTLNISEGRADVFGTMAGKISVADGAVFSPGDGIGTLTVNGLFSADDGARLVFEIGEDTSDLIVLESEGTLDISEDAILELLFTDADPDKVYTLIEAEGGLGEYADAAFWTNLLTAAADTNWHLEVSGNMVNAVFGTDPAVPEPATWVLLILGTFGLLYCRKK